MSTSYIHKHPLNLQCRWRLVKDGLSILVVHGQMQSDHASYFKKTQQYDSLRKLTLLQRYSDFL